MYLKSETRTTFVEVGGLQYFVEAFRASTGEKSDAEDDFLLGRIGFLLSAEKSETVGRLVNQERILEDVDKVEREWTLLTVDFIAI
jgi:hypothetical protein